MPRRPRLPWVRKIQEQNGCSGGDTCLLRRGTLLRLFLPRSLTSTSNVPCLSWLGLYVWRTEGRRKYPNDLLGQQLHDSRLREYGGGNAALYDAAVCQSFISLRPCERHHSQASRREESPCKAFGSR